MGVCSVPTSHLSILCFSLLYSSLHSYSTLQHGRRDLPLSFSRKDRCRFLLSIYIYHWYMPALRVGSGASAQTTATRVLFCNALALRGRHRSVGSQDPTPTGSELTQLPMWQVMHW